MGLVRANLRNGGLPQKGCSHKPALYSASLRSFQRIDLLLVLGFNFGMGGEITLAGLPLYRRIGIAFAVTSGSELRRALAAFVLLNDWIARTTIVAATCFRHEGAFRARLHSCTNHDNQLTFCYC